MPSRPCNLESPLPFAKKRRSLQLSQPGCIHFCPHSQASQILRHESLSRGPARLLPACQCQLGGSVRNSSMDACLGACPVCAFMATQVVTKGCWQDTKRLVHSWMSLAQIQTSGSLMMAICADLPLGVGFGSSLSACSSAIPGAMNAGLARSTTSTGMSLHKSALLLMNLCMSVCDRPRPWTDFEAGRSFSTGPRHRGTYQLQHRLLLSW